MIAVDARKKRLKEAIQRTPSDAGAALLFGNVQTGSQADHAGRE